MTVGSGHANLYEVVEKIVGCSSVPSYPPPPLSSDPLLTLLFASLDTPFPHISPMALWKSPSFDATNTKSAAAASSLEEDFFWLVEEKQYGVHLNGAGRCWIEDWLPYALLNLRRFWRVGVPKLWLLPAKADTAILF